MVGVGQGGRIDAVASRFGNRIGNAKDVFGRGIRAAAGVVDDSARGMVGHRPKYKGGKAFVEHDAALRGVVTRLVVCMANFGCRVTKDDGCCIHDELAIHSGEKGE